MDFKIKSYEAKYETGWLRCRVLSFLETAYFDDVLQNKPRYKNPSDELIAISKNTIIGLIDVEYDSVQRSVGTSDNCKSGMIWNIAVHPEYHGIGIGYALMDKARHLAEKRGVKRLEAWTRDDFQLTGGISDRVSR